MEERQHHAVHARRTAEIYLETFTMAGSKTHPRKGHDRLTDVGAVLRIFAIALTCAVLTACGGGGGDSGGNISIAGNQGPDPATVDFPVFYVKKPVAAVTPTMPASDLRVLLTFNVGADLYTRDRASPTATETNLTAAILNGKGDVRDVDVSYDGKKAVFAMRGPKLDNVADKNQPKWAIWEYDISSKSLHRVISSDTTANEGHDVAPHYLPDGRIVFSSTRQRQSGAILLDEGKPQFSGQNEDNKEPAFVLHVMDADGSNIHQISFNQSHDRDPSVLASGKVIFTRWSHALGHASQMDLYQMNPDGTDLELLYGNRSHATGTALPVGGNSTIQFTQPRALPDGRVLAITMPFTGTDEGGDLIAINVTDYVENTQPTLPNAGVLSGPAQTRIPAADISTLPGPSAGGRYRSAFPLFDGTNRMLVSWSQCRVLDAGNIVPCTTDRLADPVTYPSAAPLYGIFIYDINQNTQLPIVAPQEGFIYTDVVSAYIRTLPPVILDQVAGVDFDAKLAAESVGILYIKSVYDIDGTDAAPGGITAVRNPAVTIASNRPSRFVRIEKVVSLPDRDTLDPTLVNQTFGPGGRTLGLEEILGYAPVEPDGSVKIKVPANVAFTINVLDQDGRRISPRHRSWLQLRAGETVTCNGCHNPSSTPPLSHGRSNLFAPKNPGAPTTGAPFPATDPALFADMGETMAQTRTRISCQTDCAVLTPSMDVLFDDVWTDPTSAGHAKDPSIAYKYSDLKTAPPTTLACETKWSSGCRVTIHYLKHLQPLWELDRGPPDAVTNVGTRTCINCHNPKDAAAASQVPAGQLDLTSAVSADNANQVTSYRKLLFTHNEQGLNMGQLQDRQVQVGVDPVTNLPQFASVTVGPPLSAGNARGANARFFSKFAAGGSHAGDLSLAELRLISEWVDIGAQYYNDPFAVPVN